MNKNEAKDVHSLHTGAVKALKRAVTRALAEHESAGVPAAIWRDGKVVHLIARRSRKRRK
jgi:hypothetical protein